MLFDNILTSYPFKFDRYLKENLSLPNDWNQVEIPQNEIVNEYNINIALQKIYENFVYLYSLTNIASNFLPVSCTGFAAGTPRALSASRGPITYFGARKSPLSAVPLSTYGYAPLDKLNDGFFVKPKTKNYLLGFFVSDNYINVLSAAENQSSIGVLLSTNKVTEGSLLTFSKLNSIAIDKNNFIYLIDSTLNSMYKYDVNSFFVEDNVTGQKILYADSTGGEGTPNDLNKFKTPTKIDIYNDLIYVLDKDNYVIKAYDLNLNFKTLYRNELFFTTNVPTAFRINQNNGKIYIGHANKKLSIMNYDFSDLTTISLSASLSGDNSIIDFAFSEEDKNIFYVVSDKNIYKRFISKPQNLAGKFLLSYNSISADSFKFATLNLYNNKDRLNVYGSLNNRGIFYSFLEDANYQSILSNTNFDAYTFGEIKINMEEYSQDWVYMKNTYKMLINILNLRDRIVKRFAGRYNDVGELLYFGKVYLSDEDVKVEKFNLSLNYFPSVNEPYSSSVFNRGSRKLHDFCEQMLHMLKDTQLNIWPPLSSIYVIS